MIKTIIATLLMGLLVFFFPIKNKTFSYVAFVAYIFAVLLVTLLIRGDQNFGQVHLMPLEQVVIWIKRYYLAYGVRKIFDPLFGLYLNVLLFVPFGFLLHLPPRKTVFFGFLFSLTIEVIQLVTRLGMFETDDLMTNTLGAWLGTVANRKRTRNASLR